MKKTKYQIFLIVLIMIIGILSVCIERVYAASTVQVSSHNSKVGEAVAVSITLPDGTNSYNGTITWDASKLQYVGDSCSGTLEGSTLYVANGNSNDGAVENFTVTFNIIAEGEAVVAAKLRCLDYLGNILHNDTNYGSIKTTAQNNQAPKEPTFTDVNETVYTKDSCNVRESYSTDSKKITKLEKGRKLKRIGVGDNGWSKVEYNGKTVYISSQFLTTEKPPDPKFKEVNEVMYAGQECNVRKSFTIDSDKVGYLKLGDEVKVTGIGDNGWSKIEYKGEVAYVKSTLLVKEKPEPPENNIIDNNAIDGNLIENDLLGSLQNEIGVIPEVGKNYSEYIYIVITLTVLISVLYINFKARNEEK
jgi:uncharacterized protein YgiM (DUF1202 family)